MAAAPAVRRAVGQAAGGLRRGRGSEAALAAVLLALAARPAACFAPAATVPSPAMVLEDKGVAAVEHRLMRAEGGFHPSGSLSAEEEEPSPAHSAASELIASLEAGAAPPVDADNHEQDLGPGFYPPVLPSNGSYTAKSQDVSGSSTAIYNLDFGIDGGVTGDAVDTTGGEKPREGALENGRWDRENRTVEWEEVWNNDTDRRISVFGHLLWAGHSRTIMYLLYKDNGNKRGFMHLKSSDDCTVPILSLHGALTIIVSDETKMIRNQVLPKAEKAIIANIVTKPEMTKCVNIKMEAVSVPKDPESGGIKVTYDLNLVCFKATSYNNLPAQAMMNALSPANAQGVWAWVNKTMDEFQVEYTIRGVNLEVPKATTVNPDPYPPAPAGAAHQGAGSPAAKPAGAGGNTAQTASGQTVQMAPQAKVTATKSPTQVAQDIAANDDNASADTLTPVNASTNSTACRLATPSRLTASLAAAAAAAAGASARLAP